MFVADGDAFTGDAVLGAGSVFIAPDGGGLGAVPRRAAAAARARAASGSSPATGRRSTDPDAKLDEYVAHRLERERRDPRRARGRRCATRTSCVDAAWDDVPEGLRLPARWTLQAHLEKLRAEGRLP